MTQTNENLSGMLPVVDLSATSNGGAEFTAPVCEPVPVQNEPVPLQPVPVVNAAPEPCLADSISVYFKSAELVNIQTASPDMVTFDLEFGVSRYCEGGNGLSSQNVLGTVKKRIVVLKSQLITDLEHQEVTTKVAVIEKKIDKAGWYIMNEDGKTIDGPMTESDAKAKINKDEKLTTVCYTPADIRRMVNENMTAEEKAKKAAQRARELAGIPHSKNWT